MSIGLVACSSGSSSGGAGGTTGTPGAGGSIADVAAAPAGWTQVTCSQGVNVQSGDLIEASGSNLVVTTAFFDDGSNCNQANIFRVDKTTFTAITYGTNSVETTATNVNLTETKVEIKATAPGEVSNFNTGSMCGLTGWQLNVYRDVTNTSCGSPGRVYYTIMKILGNNLYIGMDSGGNDGSTDLKRHTVLNTTDYYAK